MILDTLQGDEWEEKWGEHYWSKGKAQKWADKWGKEGSNVWHEKWGEDYPPGGDACFKYTDKVIARTHLILGFCILSFLARRLCQSNLTKHVWE